MTTTSQKMLKNITSPLHNTLQPSDIITMTVACIIGLLAIIAINKIQNKQ